MDAVVMQHLSKIYDGGKTAVADMSLTLEQGEVFGFLGPNGAGKTPLFKSMLELTDFAGHFSANAQYRKGRKGLTRAYGSGKMDTVRNRRLKKGAYLI